MVIALYCPMEATTTKITKKQKTLLTELLEDFDGDVEDLLGKHRQVMELKRRGLEAMLEGEFTDHLGDEPHNPRATARGIHATGRGADMAFEYRDDVHRQDHTVDASGGALL